MRIPAVLLLAAAQLPLAEGSAGRDPDMIRGIVGSVEEHIVTGYEELLESSPGTGGTLSASFAITPEGSVNDVSVEASEDLQPLVPGLMEVIESLDFGVSEEQTDDIDVTIPFTLLPTEDTLTEGDQATVLWKTACMLKTLTGRAPLMPGSLA